MSDQASTPLPPNHHRDYPRFAGISGAIAGLTMVPGAGRVAQVAINLTAVSDQDRVVDVGCGPGTAARAAARQGAAVTGVDPAPVMLKLARWLTPRAATSITWSQGTAEALPLADHSATALWSLKTVHHWSDLDAGLGEAHRVLVCGGRLLAIERHTKPGATGLASHGWTETQADAFADRCRRSGFTNSRVRAQTIGRKHLIIVQAENR
jgi:ubiquinone/menaquinone biosynthesis C-methylase UbiE